LGSVTADECIVVSDARRKELYWARYVSGVRVEGPAVNKPDEISELFPQGKFIGPAADLYPEFINGSVLQIEAGNLAQLFTQGTGQIHEVVPMYLRKPDAVEPTTRKQVLR
jgi:tRNA A37 threonylcarbamoyladenosine modification protein TsaB